MPQEILNIGKTENKNSESFLRFGVFLLFNFRSVLTNSPK